MSNNVATTAEPRSIVRGTHRQYSPFVTNSCPRCHHYHRNVQIPFTTDEHGGLQTDWKCEHCCFKPWDLGRRHTTLSLASQHTIPDMKDFYKTRSRKSRLGKSDIPIDSLGEDPSEADISERPSAMQTSTQPSSRPSDDRPGGNLTEQGVQNHSGKRIAIRLRSLMPGKLLKNLRGMFASHAHRADVPTPINAADPPPIQNVDSLHNEGMSQLPLHQVSANSIANADRVPTVPEGDHPNETQAKISEEALAAYRAQLTKDIHENMSQVGTIGSSEAPTPPFTIRQRPSTGSFTGSNFLGFIHGAGSISLSYLNGELNQPEVHVARTVASPLSSGTGSSSVGELNPDRRGSETSYHSSPQSEDQTLVGSVRSSSVGRGRQSHTSSLRGPSRRASHESALATRASTSSHSPAHTNRTSQHRISWVGEQRRSRQGTEFREVNGEVAPSASTEQRSLSEPIHEMQENDEQRPSGHAVHDFAHSGSLNGAPHARRSA